MVPYHKIKHFVCHRDFFVHRIPCIKHTQNAKSLWEEKCFILWYPPYIKSNMILESNSSWLSYEKRRKWKSRERTNAFWRHANGTWNGLYIQRWRILLVVNLRKFWNVAMPYLFTMRPFMFRRNKFNEPEVIWDRPEIRIKPYFETPHRKHFWESWLVSDFFSVKEKFSNLKISFKGVD